MVAKETKKVKVVIGGQPPSDLTARYNTTPVLVETFVKSLRYIGTVWRVSGSTRVGATQECRGLRQVEKDIRLQPQCNDWKQSLNR